MSAVPGLPRFGVALADGPYIGYLRYPPPTASSFLVLTTTPAIGRDAPPAGPVDRGALHHEIGELGFSCGGFALSAIGIGLATAAAPATGGLSATGAVLLYAPAAASGVQCAVSIDRVWNEFAGDHGANVAMERSPVYRYGMPALTVVGLVGTGSAFRDIAAADKALAKGGASFWNASFDQLSRQQRLTLTSGLELGGPRRASSATINLLMRKSIVDAVGAGLDTADKVDGGLESGTIQVWLAGPAQP